MANIHVNLGQDPRTLEIKELLPTTHPQSQILSPSTSTDKNIAHVLTFLYFHSRVQQNHTLSLTSSASSIPLPNKVLHVILREHSSIRSLLAASNSTQFGSQQLPIAVKLDSCPRGLKHCVVLQLPSPVQVECAIVSAHTAMHREGKDRLKLTVSAACPGRKCARHLKFWILKE
jgi:hypothetical protein